MKAFIHEMVLVLESVLFWVAALPLAAFAWPMLLLSERVRRIATVNNRGARRVLGSHLAYELVR